MHELSIIKCKEVIQNYKTGELLLVEVSPPSLKKGFVLVRNFNSLISAGTEKYMLEMERNHYLGKQKKALTFLSR